MTIIMSMMSMISPLMKHPMSLGSLLIMQTIMMSINMSTKYSNSWYSYILFITMIGGMMIMFMYMSSIASNEKFKYNKKMIMLMMLMLMMMNIIEKNDYSMESWNKLIEQKLMMNNQDEQMSTMKFFNLNKSNLTIMMIITLLLTMVSITNISNTFEGPLKKTYV